jgi:hypothetical protein
MVLLSRRALTSLVQDDVLTAIRRHQSGDWGDVPNEDRQKNEWFLDITSGMPQGRPGVVHFRLHPCHP